LDLGDDYAVIAIDGPAASGKTTVGRLLAEALGFLFLDTGCMYRAVTAAALQRQIEIDDEAAVDRLIHEIKIDVKIVQGEREGRIYAVLVDGRELTWELHSPAVDAHVSLISSYLSVRTELVQQQRKLANHGRVVMVGRDIGTVVKPDAQLKLFITASPEERARRRWGDRQNQGHSDEYDTILKDVIRRDKFDSGRQYAPLRPAEDAIIIDSTDKPAETIVAQILDMLRHESAPDYADR
jgi:cytidylate kinase